MSEQIILTVLVPAYNVANYLEKCIFSMLPYDYYNSKKLEILIVNDGSKDNTLDIAEKIACEHAQVKVVNKDNGGHGSTINVAIRMARGKYFRIIDGDDWVDSTNFIKFIDLLTKTDADLVLTDASYEFTDQRMLQPYISYNLEESISMDFDDVLKRESAFAIFGPVLASSTYKLEKLKKANFKITEHSAYVDMEFNAFAITYVNTIIYYPLDIYRYLIGRSGQTISPDVWKRKYLEHKNIIFNLIDFVVSTNKISVYKENYIIDKLISPMIDSQVFIYDQICKLNELKEFLEKLSDIEKIYSRSISFIYSKNGDSKKILVNLESYLSDNKGSIIKKNSNEDKEDDSNKNLEIKALKAIKLIKKLIKCFLPYGVIRLYQKKKYGF